MNDIDGSFGDVRSRDILLLPGIATALILCYFWWQKIRYLELIIAMNGFSPIDWVYQIHNSENYLANFPSGITQYSKSAIMHIYLIAYSWLGARPEALLPFVVGLEIAALAGAVYLLARKLLPSFPSHISLAVALLAVASDVRYLDLSRWGPFFGGQFYNFAHACGILGLLLAVERRYITSSLMFSISFVIHPIIGLLWALFGIASQVRSFLSIHSLRDLVVPSAMYILITGTWWAAVIRANAAVPQVPSKDWMDLALLNSVHWFPLDYGLFTHRHEERFVQFLSFALIMACFWPAAKGNEDPRRGLLYGLVAMLGLTTLGVLLSATKFSPFLTKLAMHRACNQIIFVGMVYVVSGLFASAQTGAFWRRFVAAALLFSPVVFGAKPGFPLVFSLLLVVPVVRKWSRKEKLTGGELVSVVLALACILLVGIYWLCGIPLRLEGKAYSGLSNLRFLAFPAAFLIVSVLAEMTRRGRWAPLCLWAILAIAAINWTGHQKPNDRFLARARSYRQTQDWAKANTAKDALFMTDPTIWYGWRDFSRRSSFGNLREWLHTSFLYSSDLKLLEEGMRRFNEFDIDLGPYLATRPPLDGLAKLSKDVRIKFYSFGADKWQNLAETYGIDYFVFERRFLEKTIPMPVAFVNDGFVVGHWDENWEEKQLELTPVQIKVERSLLPMSVEKSFGKNAGFRLGGIRGKFHIEEVKENASGLGFIADEPGGGGKWILQIIFPEHIPDKLPSLSRLGLNLLTNYEGEGTVSAFIQQKTASGWKRNEKSVQNGIGIETSLEVLSFPDAQFTDFGFVWYPKEKGERLEVINASKAVAPQQN